MKKKVNLGKLPFLYPMPMTIVGALVNGKPNFMAVAWVAPVNHDPPMIGIALGKTHLTNTGIKETKSFSICIPDIDLVRQTDYVGLVSGRDVDKSQAFTVFFQDRKDIPLIAECPVCIQLSLERIIDLPSNEFFIGSVIATFMDERCVRNGKPDLRRITPFTLTMPDNNYWEVGAFLGKAWSTGKDFVKKPTELKMNREPEDAKLAQASIETGDGKPGTACENKEPPSSKKCQESVEIPVEASHMDNHDPAIKSSSATKKPAPKAPGSKPPARKRS